MDQPTFSNPDRTADSEDAVLMDQLIIRFQIRIVWVHSVVY
jgi:hypothetical protein